MARRSAHILPLIVVMVVSIITLAASPAQSSMHCQSEREDVSLFDRYGKAIAYLTTDNDRTIYLWDGTPVAYLIHKGDLYYLYGFNGKHLGRFERGFIIDHQGNAVACIAGVTRIQTETEPLKSPKQLKPEKARIEQPRLFTQYSRYWSNTPLALFLRAGIEK